MYWFMFVLCLIVSLSASIWHVKYRLIPQEGKDMALPLFGVAVFMSAVASALWFFVLPVVVVALIARFVWIKVIKPWLVGV